MQGRLLSKQAMARSGGVAKPVAPQLLNAQAEISLAKGLSSASGSTQVPPAAPRTRRRARSREAPSFAQAPREQSCSGGRCCTSPFSPAGPGDCCRLARRQPHCPPPSPPHRPTVSSRRPPPHRACCRRFPLAARSSSAPRRLRPHDPRGVASRQHLLRRGHALASAVRAVALSRFRESPLSNRPGGPNRRRRRPTQQAPARRPAFAETQQRRTAPPSYRWVAPPCPAPLPPAAAPNASAVACRHPRS